MNWLMLIVLTIAAARATHLVADDDIPFGALRTWAMKRFPNYGHGLGCTFCVSIWAGAASSWMAAGMGWSDMSGGFDRDLAVFTVTWFAIAQLIILLEALVEFLMGSDD